MTRNKLQLGDFH